MLSSEPPPASVVVVTRNRAASLRRTLEALARLDYPSYETLVVDHSSADDTAAVAAAAGARVVTCPPAYGIGRCRQAGVAAARGEVIAMCDDDCVPVPGWLSALVARLRAEPAAGLVAGRIENIGFPGERRYKGRTRTVGPNGVLAFARSDDEAEFFGNANLAFTREAITAIGGYDPFYYATAEIDLQLMLRRAGYRIVYEPRAEVAHHFTGVDHKHHRLFFDGELMRLYRHLKHRPPHGAAAWGRFWRDELRLLAGDLRRGLRAVGSGVKRGTARRLREGLLMVFNAVSARLAVPWLLARGRRRLGATRGATAAESAPAAGALDDRR